MNQTVAFHRLTGGDSRNGYTYNPPADEPGTQVAALYEPAYGTVTTQTGATTQAESRVVTPIELALGDLIEGHVVKRVVPVVELDGTIREWEAFL